MIVWKSHKFILFFFIFFFNPKTSFSPRHPMIFLLRERKSAGCVCACLYTSLLQERSFGMLWNFLLLYFSLFSSSCCCCASCACKNIQTAFFFRKKSTWEENHKKSNLILLIYSLHLIPYDDETKTGMYGKLFIFWCSLISILFSFPSSVMIAL